MCTILLAELSGVLWGRGRRGYVGLYGADMSFLYKWGILNLNEVILTNSRGKAYVQF